MVKVHFEGIDWERLLREFGHFEPDQEIGGLDTSPFVRSLIHPVPKFVQAFIERKNKVALCKDEAVRALYGFLLEKRYQERLNLLHFAFKIFDEDTQLPQEVIDRTPFPHEDGIPRFTHINDPNFVLE
jgi:hypothetical protein